LGAFYIVRKPERHLKARQFALMMAQKSILSVDETTYKNADKERKQIWNF
jgi:hypothetical protein